MHREVYSLHSMSLCVSSSSRERVTGITSTHPRSGGAHEEGEQRG